MIHSRVYTKRLDIFIYIVYVIDYECAGNAVRKIGLYRQINKVFYRPDKPYKNHWSRYSLSYRDYNKDLYFGIYL